jgi:type II secretory pathway pseudopilin PulG
MQTQRRNACTLIELLVVMAILMFLFGLGIGFLPSVYQRWETTYGIQTVQNTLARARQEARRSGRPTGVRFPIQAGNLVTSLKIVQQPLDDIYTNAAPAAILGNDYLVPDGAGLPIQTPVAAGATLNNMRYRLVHTPQPLAGEKTINLPTNVCVDMTRASTDGKTATGLPPSGVEPAPSNLSYTDIVFSPFGCITAANWPNDKIILWVRDSTLTDPTKGSPTLIVIYIRTGLIAAHPVDITGAPNLSQPYSFANDPRTSGL